MKKIFFVLVLLLAGAGCVPQPPVAATPESEVEKQTEFVFNDEWYSLTLPADFVVEPGAAEGYLLPKHEGDFPVITLFLMSSGENPDMQEVLNDEQVRLANLCNQTDTCQTMVDWVLTEIGGHQALEFTTEGPGGMIDHPEGTERVFTYYVPVLHYERDPNNVKDTNLYRNTYIHTFSITVSEGDDEAALHQAFDDIMSTIEFKW